jgi:hypothetical protein
VAAVCIGLVGHRHLDHANAAVPGDPPKALSGCSSTAQPTAVDIQANHNFWSIRAPTPQTSLPRCPLGTQVQSSYDGKARAAEVEHFSTGERGLNRNLSVRPRHLAVLTFPAYQHRDSGRCLKLCISLARQAASHIGPCSRIPRLVPEIEHHRNPSFRRLVQFASPMINGSWMMLPGGFAARLYSASWIRHYITERSRCPDGCAAGRSGGSRK